MELQAARMTGKLQWAEAALTPRELQVKTLLLLGLNNKEIAAKLGNSLRAVKYQVSNILLKTGEKNRLRLMATTIKEARRQQL